MNGLNVRFIRGSVFQFNSEGVSNQFSIFSFVIVVVFQEILSSRWVETSWDNNNNIITGISGTTRAEEEDVKYCITYFDIYS